MQSQIFRKKSVERITSPEQLQYYMRVTSSGVWMVLAAVIVLLAGVIVSSAVVSVDSTIQEQAVVDGDGALTIGLPLDQKELVQPGMVVRVADREAKITTIFQRKDETQVIAEMTDSDEKLPAGTYDVEIVTETVKPISFLFNRAGMD